jgi:glutamine synthetase
VENTKGEAETGQEELNIRYADRARLRRPSHDRQARGQGNRLGNGRSVTFLPKWHHDKVGSSSHVHQSLWARTANRPSSIEGDYGMSETMRHYHGGPDRVCARLHLLPGALREQLQALPEGHLRADQDGLVGRQPHRRFPPVRRRHQGVRVECRIGGSDINPYLASPRMLAAGLKGIEDKLELAPPTSGDVYEATRMPRKSRDPARSTETLRNSKMLREALGDAVVDHYTRCAEWEQEEFDRGVTDWEIARGFERS